jgi:uncharacterized protein YcfJ
MKRQGMKLLIVLLYTGLTFAQDSWSRVESIPVGQRVRIETATQKQTGQLVSVSDDSVRLDTTTVLRSEVTRVYVQSASHRKRNAIIGTVIGAGVGIAVYATLGLLLRNEGGEGTEVLLIAPAAAGAAIGAAIPTGKMKKVYDVNRR